MKVYILKEKNTTVGQGREQISRPGAIIATFVCEEHISPPVAVQRKLKDLGYELQVYAPTTVSDSMQWYQLVRDEVRIDHDLETGPAEWPEKH